MLIVFVSRLIAFAKAKNENIVTALITEGDKPVKNANPHRLITIMIEMINSYLNKRFNGLRSAINIKYMIPT